MEGRRHLALVEGSSGDESDMTLLFKGSAITSDRTLDSTSPIVDPGGVQRGDTLPWYHSPAITTHRKYSTLRNPSPLRQQQRKYNSPLPSSHSPAMHPPPPRLKPQSQSSSCPRHPDRKYSPLPLHTETMFSHLPIRPQSSGSPSGMLPQMMFTPSTGDVVAMPDHPQTGQTTESPSGIYTVSTNVSPGGYGLPKNYHANATEDSHKLSSTQRSSKILFTPHESIQLLSFWAIPEIQWRTKRDRDFDVWGYLSSSLKGVGYNRSPTQCKHRINNLVGKYHQIRKTSVDPDTVNFPYYDIIEDVMKKRQEIRSQHQTLGLDDVPVNIVSKAKSPCSVRSKLEEDEPPPPELASASDEDEVASNATVVANQSLSSSNLSGHGRSGLKRSFEGNIKLTGRQDEIPYGNLVDGFLPEDDDPPSPSPPSSELSFGSDKGEIASNAFDEIYQSISSRNPRGHERIDKERSNIKLTARQKTPYEKGVYGRHLGNSLHARPALSIIPIVSRFNRNCHQVDLIDKCLKELVEIEKDRFGIQQRQSALERQMITCVLQTFQAIIPVRPNQDENMNE